MDPFSVLRLVWLLFGAMLFAVFSIFSHASHAYVPKAKTILERTAKKRGTGLYVIDQEVTFRQGEISTSLKEKWIVKHGEAMAVTASGDGFFFKIIYKDKEKFFVDSSGGYTKQAWTEDFFEDIFHYRSWQSLAEAFIRTKILPPEVLENPKPIETVEEIKYEREPFVRLTRIAGTISYGLGSPTPVEATNNSPGVWLEQDKFLIKKLRWPSQVEVKAQKYSGFKRGFWFPQERIVNWGDGGSKKVFIKVRSVKSFGTSSSLEKRLDPDSIKIEKSKYKMKLAETTLADLISEFYQRFR